MKRTVACLRIIFLVILCLGLCFPGAAQSKRPNIVLILADDLGYSDLGCYGGEIATPNLDRLAANGIRYASFYNTSRCCPTRAALLTGMYNHNAGIGEMTTNRGLPGYQGALAVGTVTLAEVLKAAGYHTAMVGKWHVSNTLEQPTAEAQLRWLNHQDIHPYFSPVEQYPVNRGFERYFGNIWGVVDYFDPFSLVSGTTPVTRVPDHYYHTDAINDTAAQYIRLLSREKAPFFLYVAHTAPHWPLQALPEDIHNYENTYTAGWDAIRKQRYHKMAALGLIDTFITKLSPREAGTPDWNDNPHKDWEARAMAVHAAMVDRMDQGIGRIITALKQEGQLENTLIIFLSDNGASPENAMAYGPGFDRPGTTRKGERICYPVNKEVLPGPQTSFTSIGAAWANVANTPYRFAKASSFEGGVRTPVIASWPKGITGKGRIERTTGHVIDFMATFLELAYARYPAQYNGHVIKPMQGMSLVPSFNQKAAPASRILFNEHFGARYVRDGNRKLVAAPGKPWQLFDLQHDATELHDLSARFPEQVQRLSALWEQWAQQNHVFPKKK
ncbi:arylsulfatase [Niabella sp. CC-SYL272]|uniref:arylsulfatase n=1 Tax=Niabella agricola TaxID=2891571 RepID=UPI001F41CDD0|nr:arylsulfatase [Niabella agricola]MCF3107792.1 arylsulfatase [Niabella agricola]